MPTLPASVTVHVRIGYSCGSEPFERLSDVSVRSARGRFPDHWIDQLVAGGQVMLVPGFQSLGWNSDAAENVTARDVPFHFCPVFRGGSPYEMASARIRWIENTSEDLGGFIWPWCSKKAQAGVFVSDMTKAYFNADGFLVPGTAALAELAAVMYLRGIN